MITWNLFRAAEAIERGEGQAFVASISALKVEIEAQQIPRQYRDLHGTLAMILA